MYAAHVMIRPCSGIQHVRCLEHGAFFNPKRELGDGIGLAFSGGLGRGYGRGWEFEIAQINVTIGRRGQNLRKIGTPLNAIGHPENL